MRSLNNDLKSLITDDNIYVKQLMHYFNFENWVQSKMKKAVINV